MLEYEFSNLKEIIENARNGDFSPRLHGNVLAIVRNSPEETLRNNAALISSYFEEMILFQSDVDNSWEHCDSLCFVDEDKYKLEMEALLLMAGYLQYSDAIKRWASEVTRETIQKMLSDGEFQDGINNWKYKSHEERIGLIINQINEHMIVSGKNNIKFISPSLLVDEATVDMAFAYTPNFSEGPDALHIRMTTPLFEKDDAFDAMSYACHEVIHCTTWQLAHAAHCGILNSKHALYRDASMRRDLIDNGVYYFYKIDSHYRRSADEQLAYGQQRLFKELIAGPHFCAQPRIGEPHL